jgi:N-acetylneuraminate synthase/N,N'-diacetyllegionaminate synthase
MIKSKVKIENNFVGSGEQVFFIAEMGVNHDNNYSQAIELIDIAADAGADAVKLQLYYAENMWPKKSHSYEILKKLETNREWVPDLIKYSKSKNILLFSSPFDSNAIDLVANLKTPAIKWASSQIYDLQLLRYASEKMIPMILATGACNLVDVDRAVKTVSETGNSDLILMHCVSAYPTLPKDANLRIMDTLLQRFQCPVGFSDHTIGEEVPLAAVARGASIIEKHFTISRGLAGPDHGFAIEPSELKELIFKVRELETFLGSSEKKFIDGAEDQRYIVRLFAKNYIKSGTKITKDMITIKRADNGFLPYQLDSIIGADVLIDIPADEPISKNSLSYSPNL